MERYNPRPLPEPLFSSLLLAEHETPEVKLAQTHSTVAVPTELPFAGSAPPTHYTTCWGIIPFEEIYQRTRRYTAHILHHTFYVQEVDDGLQAGYLALYRRLKDEPTLLTGKSLSWIGKFLSYAALHATRGDYHTRQRCETFDGQRLTQDTSGYVIYSPVSKTHSSESRQTDTRIDLLAGIKTTAHTILAQPNGKQQEHSLWALYGMTMLQVCAADLSRLFNAREQSIQAAYTRVRQLLQEKLKDYAPKTATKPIHGRGQKAPPREDMPAIRIANREVSGVIYDRVKAQIESIKADTMKQDLLAFAGIQQKIPAQTHARAHGLPTSWMQRAYDRVHLLIGAQRDPNIRPRRPERRVKSVFVLTQETEKAVHQLALELLKQPKSYEKLVALHAHISNLAISTTAKHFNIPTSTLRFYAQQIGKRLGTPTKPARQ